MPPRRAAVLAEAMRGASLQEIGDRLGIKRSTVHSHLKAARRDLGAQTTVQAIGLAWVRLVTTPPPDLPTDSPDRVPVEVEDYLAVFTDALRGDGARSPAAVPGGTAAWVVAEPGLPGGPSFRAAREGVRLLRTRRPALRRAPTSLASWLWNWLAKASPPLVCRLAAPSA